MSDGTEIAWTDATWNPIVGCSRVSAGCEHCYAERFMHRGLHHKGLTRATSRGPVWTGEVRLVEKALDLPLLWRKPRKIFVDSMSDLFQDGVPFEYIGAVFGAMGECRRHTFQILTKRPERMLAFFRWITERDGPPRYEDGGEAHGCAHLFEDVRSAHYKKLREALNDTDPQRRWDTQGEIDRWLDRERRHITDPDSAAPFEWPLPNVWLGVSCENQETADERIPLLLQTPAAIRFVSAEPLLGAINFTPWLQPTTTHHMVADVEGMLRNRSFDFLRHDDGRPMTRREAEDELYALHAKGVAVISCGGCDAFDPKAGCPGHAIPRLDWVIVGGESGPGARPCDVAWIRSIVEQCRKAGVAAFVKQLGARPFDSAKAYPEGECVDSMVARFRDTVHDRKSGDPSEWPEDLRVREMPHMEERA